jgi:hypothetical protein
LRDLSKLGEQVIFILDIVLLILLQAKNEERKGQHVQKGDFIARLRVASPQGP